jgi:mannosyl-oligosaccharide alpha-1,3-glucosidase
MVAIIDPHLKRANDYPVYKEATEKGLLVKNKDGKKDFEGWCWTGSSSWIDMFNPESWEWWKKLFVFDPKAKKDGWNWLESNENIHIWNDMNEVR